MTHRNFMIDLETLSTNNDAVILSIGAVEFTLPKFDESFQEGKLGAEFYQNVDPQSCLDAGMTINASTIDWWQDQSVEAQKALRENRVNINAALTLLWGYLRPTAEDTCTVWAHGDVFDIAILNNAYRFTFWKETPWKYNAVRDARTAYDLTGVWPGSEHDDEGAVAHNALADAKRQARAVIQGIRTIERLKYDHTLLFRKANGYGEPADDIMQHILDNPPPPIVLSVEQSVEHRPDNVIDILNIETMPEIIKPTPPLSFPDHALVDTSPRTFHGDELHADDCDCPACRLPF